MATDLYNITSSSSLSKLTPSMVANAGNTSVIATSTSATDYVPAGKLSDIADAGLSANDAGAVLAAVNGTSTKMVTKDGKNYTVAANGDLIPETVDNNEIVVSANTGSPSSTVDGRLRISALPQKEVAIYGPKSSDNILNPLHATQGLLFPYTPSIQVAGESNWDSHNLVHTNYDVLSYQRTPSATIGISGKFTVQNQREGAYAIAAIHFLRTITKMHYGDQESAQNNAENNAGQSAVAGLPPPVLRLRGYGKYMFNDLRCIVRGFSFNFDDNMNLVPVSISGGKMYLPPVFTLTVNISLQQSPRKVRRDFNLEDFRTGAALRKTGGYWF